MTKRQIVAENRTENGMENGMETCFLFTSSCVILTDCTTVMHTNTIVQIGNVFPALDKLHCVCKYIIHDM